MKKKAVATLVILVAAIAASTRSGQAHKAITSKYTYNDDVFPIFREKCTPCHVEGGVAPMSLMTYELAYPWAESIRAELIASHMPPWNADEGVGAFTHARRLTAKEVDIILTWATGGNPKGQIDQKVPDVPLKNDWAIGKPDITLQLPSFALDADKMEDTVEFRVSTGLTEPRWVRAADLLPGTPSIVRSATISKAATVGSGPDYPRDDVLAHWVPGQQAESPASEIGFLLQPGADLLARVHYKKTWQLEGKAMTDRSTVGLYFSGDTNTQPLRSVTVSSARDAAPSNQTIAFSQPITQDVTALAVVPEQVPPNIVISAEAVLPNGTRTPIIKLNTRADWIRRYWFAKPIALPRGSRIDVVARLEDPDLLSSAFSVPATPPRAAGPIVLHLDVIPVRTAPAAQ
jgi:hypothetical protein